jgi:hypothetical protein
MRMKRAIVCLLGGLTLAALSGPASAQRVTYPVDLVYEKLVDGPRPRKTIRVTMRAISAQAAETMCNSSMSMHRMSRNAIEKDPRPLGLTSDWYGVGGDCVRDNDGNIEMTVEASSGGGN